mgnify:FL=1
MIDIVFSTNNMNKFKEVKLQLPKDIRLISLKDIGCYEKIPETETTIRSNAIQKAKYVKEKYGFNCFSDDSGLEIDNLNGEPGVNSAVYAGLEKNSKKNINKVLKKLKGEKNRDAKFKTIIALYLDDNLLTFEGICEGQVTKRPIGIKGFGYDPIFIPKGFNKTFAEMTIKEKNLISHRGLAVKKLISFFNKLRPC